jgi:exosortase
MSNLETRSRQSSKARASVGRKPQTAKKPSPAQVATPEAVAVATAARPVSWQIAAGLLCLAAGVFAYWPTLAELVHAWNVEPDYSHGFLVIPLAILFLWMRRDSYPGFGASSPLLAAGLLAVSLVMRWVSARYYFSFLDGWSIVPWAAAVVAMLGGRPMLMWALPSIGFLGFMVPLPYSLEHELSGPLQRVATKLSTLALQTLGQPAFSDGNTILLGDERLLVAEACSGLRLFVSTLALTYAYITLIRRPWWEKAFLALTAIPIAIVSNATRIVVTGLLYQITDNEALRQMAHDYAGFGMIVLAAGLFWLVLWYLGKLIREDEAMDMASLVRKARI